MLSLLKKSDKSKLVQLPAWHANFRNYAALPDTKIVRTSFYVNGVLALVALLVVLAFAYQELTISDLSNQLGAVEQQLARTSPTNSKILEQYKQFQLEEQKISELESFLKGQKLVLSDFLIHLSQTKPSSIVFLNISYSDASVVIKAYAQGSPEQAASFVSAYEKQLKDDPALKSVFKTISMANVIRDAQVGRLLFDINLSFGTPKGK